jgi:pimeloyl-ACP methyl ester carboxylesterase
VCPSWHCSNFWAFRPNTSPGTTRERAGIEAFNRATKAYTDRWVAGLKKSVPGARIVDLPGAGHYIFLTREAEVVKEIRQFLESL